MQLRITNWLMPFYFVDHGVLAKRPVHVFLPKQLIAKTELQMEKPAMFVIPVLRLITALH